MQDNEALSTSLVRRETENKVYIQAKKTQIDNTEQKAAQYFNSKGAAKNGDKHPNCPRWGGFNYA